MRIGTTSKIAGQTAALLLGASFLLALPASGETLNGALIKAYNNNPDLNAQRASVRATDELVPQALSGYRPTVTGSATVEPQTSRSYSEGTVDIARKNGGIKTTRVTSSSTDNRTPRTMGVTLNQTLFDGFQTRNNVRSGESQVLAARETLRNTVQNTLFDAAQAYMDVLQNAAILDLRKNNLEVLEEELRAARERFNVGVITRTDVAQSEAAVEGARSEVSAAESTLSASRATYRQVIGEEAGKLAPGKTIDKLLPKALPFAVDQSQAGHPAIRAALHGVDAAQLQIRVIEGELLPNISLQASATQEFDTQPGLIHRRTASLLGVLSVPLYEGGVVYSRARQAKEVAGQRRLEADSARDQVRAAVVSAWGTLEAARAQIISAQAQVDAATVAVAGTREEARVGERTTLDVLIQQQALLDARTLLVQAQRDRIVASYALLSAVGWLSTERLGLKIQTYDAAVHYNQVRDKWWGLRTPDGR
jgi:outer membrane protein